MAADRSDAPVRMEKRGGYSGGRPASTLGPPPQTPSASADAKPAKKKK